MENTEFISDHEIIEAMDRSKLENLIKTLSDFSSNFQDLEGSSIDLSYFNWFRVYVKSKDFRKLNDQQQNKVFMQYDNLSYVFREINEFLHINKLGL
ncbi:hypothetical protein [Chryseobacterium sp.]|uniref:hypothetical protein n=1 Tax=Chryseobacterium sp. TaxID=1871047 RepID=UPI0011C71BEF|nr:hypothetical protein [Chryseobacterium sp.]TXF75918.1 hypothetical protein FUA25_08415 [Chryseobacterium sp.]